MKCCLLIMGSRVIGLRALPLLMTEIAQSQLRTLPLLMTEYVLTELGQ